MNTKTTFATLARQVAGVGIGSQDGRRGRLTTVLGMDALVLLRLDGTKELSGDFEWQFVVR